jgi:ribosomal protein S12 methylthiotransferase accessory factor
VTRTREVGASKFGGTGSGPGYKGYRLGTHRAVSPAETIARVTPFLDEMGITRVANVTGLDRIDIPVVMVVRPNSRSLAVSQGKGLDLDAAKASGLMESIETWHAERIKLAVRYATFAEIDGEHATVDIEALPQIREGRFHDQRRMLWIEGRNLVDGRSVWVPYEMVHTDYTHPVPPGHGCFPCSTNGLASGNHALEATCHAICEVIERDATSVWHHLPQPVLEQTRVMSDSIDDPACRDVLGRFDAAGLDVAAWDVTTDVGVPSFYCLITERDGQDGHLGAGAGCYPSRDVALLRALTEAAQTRLTYISGSRDDLLPDEFTPGGVSEKVDDARNLIGRQPPMRDFRQIPTRTADTFEDDLAWLIDRLRAVGVEQVVAVDLTRPEIGISVVRAIIPGLEAPHDDEDYLPGPRAAAAMEERP